MPLDAFCLGGVVSELNSRLAGMKVERILQPERDEVDLVLRDRPGGARLLVSTNSNYARIHVTQSIKENPAAPPMFCMLLRKHLLNARLVSVEQPALERSVRLRFACSDEFGEPCEKTLVCELMGRHSNIILVAESGHIIDCLRHVDGDMSEKRMVLPGLLYRDPPAQGKENPLEYTSDRFLQLFTEVKTDIQVDKWLLDRFFGLSPLVCRELVYLCCGNISARIAELNGEMRQKLAFAFCRLAERRQSGEYTPVLLSEAATGRPRDFSFMNISQYGRLYSQRSFTDFSSLLEEYFTRRDEAERIGQRASEMLKVLSAASARITRKLALQREELLATRGRERLRELGDILSASLHLIPRGGASVRLPDFYGEEGAEVSVTLDPRLSPQQNAQKYYKDYNRMKTAERMLADQIAAGEQELLYIDSVFDELARAALPSELAEIREELAVSGYIKSGGYKSGKKQKLSQPLRFISSDGFVIYVGKNNRQNDELTLRTASRQDIWLHTQKIPGSHVIICTEGAALPDRTLTEAAVLAALHSKARDSAMVPVDYAPVRLVKKPSGAKPGMVIYTGYKTAFVRPDPELARKLGGERKHA